MVAFYNSLQKANLLTNKFYNSKLKAEIKYPSIFSEGNMLQNGNHRDGFSITKMGLVSQTGLHWSPHLCNQHYLRRNKKKIAICTFTYREKVCIIHILYIILYYIIFYYINSLLVETDCSGCTSWKTGWKFSWFSKITLCKLQKKSDVDINLYLNVGILPIDICFWQVREVWEVQEERPGSISLQGRVPVLLPELLFREWPAGSLEVGVFSLLLGVKGETVLRRLVLCSQCVLGKKSKAK